MAVEDRVVGQQPRGVGEQRRGVGAVERQRACRQQMPYVNRRLPGRHGSRRQRRQELGEIVHQPVPEAAEVVRGEIEGETRGIDTRTNTKVTKDTKVAKSNSVPIDPSLFLVIFVLSFVTLCCYRDAVGAGADAGAFKYLSNHFTYRSSRSRW